MAHTTWTNGRVSLTSDLVFGVSVLTESGWMPLTYLEPDEVEFIRKLVDHDPTCPFEV